jgi:aspartate ammonia-lyase
LLQRNAYEPVVAVAIMECKCFFISHLPLFRKNCIDGITANEKVLNRYIETTVGIVTALNPVPGYKNNSAGKELLQSGKGILELIREKKLLTEAEIRKLMDHPV